MVINSVHHNRFNSTSVLRSFFWPISSWLLTQTWLRISLCQSEVSVTNFPKCGLLFKLFLPQSMTWLGLLKGRSSPVCQVWQFPPATEADMALSKCIRVPRELLRTGKEGKTVHWILISEQAAWDRTINVLSLGRRQTEKQVACGKIQMLGSLAFIITEQSCPGNSGFYSMKFPCFSTEIIRHSCAKFHTKGSVCVCLILWTVKFDRWKICSIDRGDLSAGKKISTIKCHTLKYHWFTIAGMSR